MDVIAIHKALTQIWPDGIERESYPVLAGLVKALFDNRPPVMVGPAFAVFPAGVPSTEPLLDGYQDSKKRYLPSSVDAFIRRGEHLHSVTHKTSRPLTSKIKAARERIRADAERLISPNPIDPDGRVSSKTLKEVYLRILSNPGSGAFAISNFLKVSMYTAQRALGVLAKLKMIEGKPQGGIQNHPWVYTAI